MTKKTACLVLAVLLLFAESAFFSFFPIEIAKPDITLPFIIYAIFFLSPAEGLVTAALLGFGQEVLCGNPMGAILFTKVGLFLCCIFLKSRLYIESKHTFSLLCAASVLIESLIYLALALVAKGEVKDVVNVMVYSIPDAILTGFVSYFLYDLLERFHLRYAERI